MSKKPIVYFDFAMHFGGSNLSTLLLIREMLKHESIIVLDAYGCCSQYLQFMDKSKIPYRIIQPNPKRNLIGGNNLFTRALHILSSSIEMLQFTHALKKQLLEISPSAIWMNSYKALKFLSLSVDDLFPLAYYARIEGVYPRWYVKNAWKKLSLIVANSESGLNRIRGSRYEISRMSVVSNGIDIDEIMRLSKVPVSDFPDCKGLKLLFPGTLNERKNQHTAIKGLAEYISHGGDATLLLAGDHGPGGFNGYAQHLPMLVKELGIEDRVHFLGWRDDIPALIGQSDVVVLTSLTEGMPRAIMEAMSLGKPILATNVSGTPELVRDGIDGLLIEPSDAEGFARALSYLSNPKVRQEMGQSAADRIRSSFDIKCKATQFLFELDKIRT